MGPGGRRDEFRVGDPTEFLSLTTTGNIGQVVDCKKDQNRPPKKPTSERFFVLTGQLKYFKMSPLFRYDKEIKTYLCNAHG